MSKIDRESIIHAALSVLDSSGEAALAMRPLAAKLGVTPMALYRYFSDRDALLLALVERVSESIPFPDEESDPQEEALALALCLHDFLVAHPWMIRLISAGRLTSPAGLRFPDGFLRCARRAGLGERDAFLFYRTVFATILGQATISSAREQLDSPLPAPAASEATPTFASLAERWSALDAEARPEVILRAAVSALRPL